MRRSLRLPSHVKRRLGAADTYSVRELHLTTTVEGLGHREAVDAEPRRLPSRGPWLLDGPGWPLLLLAADVVGRVVIRPGELEVGIVTALVGAPVFIALVRRRRIAQL